MSHNQSMDILLTTRNVSRTHALITHSAYTHGSKMAERYVDYEGENDGSRVRSLKDRNLRFKPNSIEL